MTADEEYGMRQGEFHFLLQAAEQEFWRSITRNSPQHIYGARVRKLGKNYWLAYLEDGSEDMKFCSGNGETPEKAMKDFDKNWTVEEK